MHYSCSADTEDFAHFTQESLAGSHAYLYATSGDAQHGLLEETSQVIKIPETYAEAKGSPQRADWKGACGNETDNLREYSVYTSVRYREKNRGVYDMYIYPPTNCNKGICALYIILLTYLAISRYIGVYEKYMRGI